MLLNWLCAIVFVLITSCVGAFWGIFIRDCLSYRKGYKNGHSKGYEEGHIIGYEKGREEGRIIGFQNSMKMLKNKGGKDNDKQVD